MSSPKDPVLEESKNMDNGNSKQETVGVGADDAGNSGKAGVSKKSSKSRKSRTLTMSSKASREMGQRLAELEARVQIMNVEKQMYHEKLVLERENEELVRKQKECERKQRQWEQELEMKKGLAEYEVLKKYCEEVSSDEMSDDAELKDVGKARTDEWVGNQEQYYEYQNVDEMNDYVSRSNQNVHEQVKIDMHEKMMSNESHEKMMMNEPHEEMMMNKTHETIQQMESPVEKVQPMKSPVDEGVSQNLLLDYLKQQDAPQYDIQVFDGNPLEYHAFMKQFEDVIESKISSPSGRLNRLISYTSGTAKELVKAYIYESNSDGYELAKKTLEKEYGNPYIIAVEFSKKVRAFESMTVVNGHKLMSYYLLARQMQICCNRNPDVSGELDNLQNLRFMIGKLPIRLQERWNRIATTLWKNQNRGPKFHDLVQFLKEEADVASNPTFSNYSMRSNVAPMPSGHVHVKPNQKKVFVTNKDQRSDQKPMHREQNQQNRDRKCYFCGYANHTLNKCFKFLELTVEDREKYVYENSLCFGCLEKTNSGHYSRLCSNRLTCSICNGRHATSLHKSFKKPEVRKGDGNSSVEKEKSQSNEQDDKKNSGVGDGAKVKQMSTHSSKNVALGFTVVEVKCPNGKKQKCYCFLDSLSNSSFITKEMIQMLSFERNVCDESIELNTMTGSEERKIQSVQTLVLKGLGAEVEMNLPKLYVTDELPLDSSDMISKEDLMKWPHLRHLVDEIPNYDPTVPIGLLVGNDAPRLLEPHDAVRPPREDGFVDSPYAVKYALGWTIAGPMSGMRGKLKSNRTHVKAVTDSGAVLCSETQNSEPDVKDMFNKLYSEDFVEKADIHVDGKSQEDTKFCEKMNSDIKLVDGHYQLPLPFRDGDCPNVSDNMDEAEREAYKFRSRLEKEDPEKKRRIIDFMNDMERKGFAERVPEDKLDDKGKRFFISYHSVDHPKKPSKTRVVFNCARRWTNENVSLNDLLISGPDLCNSLVGVALKWREEEHAFTSDIQDMFYMNIVPEEQRSYLRYFWWKNDELKGKPIQMQMRVHVFGAKSSPACANFALKKCADDNECDFPPETAKTLKENFYVDDLCKSCPDIESAARLAKNTRDMCAKGGYNLTKFVASDPRILKEIPIENQSKISNEDGTERIERILGMKWIITSDSLGFEIVIKPDRPNTKRGLLSCLTSVNYDPLGLISPFLLPGKRIMQTVSVAKIDWDSPVDSVLVNKFRNWLESLEKLTTVTIPRCYKPKGFGNPVSVELHSYSDACEYGFGCGVYLRLENALGDIAVSLIAGKSRVIPAAGETIPRAELQAAKLSAQLSNTIAQELSYETVDIHCHVDSLIVLGYLRNTEKRFKTYVANRVRDINGLIKPDNVHYVKSENNPGDYASRGLDASRINDLVNHKWFRGPDELYKPKSDWNVEDVNLPDLSKDKEVKSNNKGKVLSTNCQNEVSWIRIVENQSDWYSMKYRVACVMGLFDQRKLKIKVNVEILQRAENKIIQYLQNSFKEEMKNTSVLSKDSVLKKLCPYVDKNGLIRVDGRLKNTELEEGIRCPIILPKNSPIVDAIIRDCHENVAHGGRGFTVNEVRSRGYYVIHLNSKVRTLIRNCVRCRRLRGSVGEQRMADIPEDRAKQAPPFTYCAVDMFGPYVVKCGRKEHKRYVALFTDLVFRGVHLEACASMDTNSFMNAITRFFNRRGNIRLLRSDNGGNFVGCNHEIKRAMEEMSPSVRDALLEKGCDFQWKFNCPKASHHGGVFERQIGTVRRVMDSVLKDKPGLLSDEAFVTLLSEAEAVVNCRPLTYETLNDPESMMPLTPMNIMTQKTKLVLPPFGRFDQRGCLHSKMQWRRVQHLSEQFWKQFQKEYLSHVNVRQKWQHEKRNFKIGDVILLKDEALHKNDWPIGIIEHVYPDKAGFVRSVKIRVARDNLQKKPSFLERPINKIVLLVESECKD